MSSNNIVNIGDWKQKKQETIIDDPADDYESLHEICTHTANELLNELDEEYNINVQKVEYAPEMIFFFEAYKALVMKCSDQWHPFQDLAEEFMREQGIVVEYHQGGYRFTVKDEVDEDPPANDE